MNPIIPRHPLDKENVIKFALGESISEILSESNRYHLLVSVPSDATTPEPLQGRRILLAVPCSVDQLNAAYRVASGTHRAIKNSKPKTE
jgi:hypothetical protein